MLIHTSYLKILGSPLEGENPLPIFRSAQPDLKVEEVRGRHQLKSEDHLLLGQNTAHRVLPYFIQDRYSRKRSPIKLKTIIVENNVLKATFLPDYGARLYSLYHKIQGRELLFRNPVFQLANLAIRNAWFSGGIEWNVSHYGHNFSTCSPLFAAICLNGAASERFLRFYHFERCKEIFWSMDFHLPEGSETLHLYVKIINPKDQAESMYWWTNIAIPEERKVRVFSEGSRVIYMAPELSRGFGQAEMPYLPCLPGEDASFPDNFQHSCEYFFQNDSKPNSPWEAAVYNDGQFFFERSSSILRYRKMFCWGTHRGGQRWKDFLSQPSKGNYLEIQAGLAPTQLHGLEIPPETSWDFLQVFGAGAADKTRSCDDWGRSSEYVQKEIDQIITDEQIQELYTKYQILGESRPEALLHSGDAWAALEVKRKEWPMPDSMLFPESALGPAQDDWLHLLEKGFLAEPDKSTGRVPSWMVSPSWLPLLEASFHIAAGANWYSHLHLGVFYYENFMYQKALHEWQESLIKKENPLAYRNIGYHYWKGGDPERALSYYQAVFALKIPGLDRAYTEEYLEILLGMQRYEAVWDYYQVDKNQRDYTSGPLAVLVGRAAVELAQNAYVDELLASEYPQLREGENLLLDIWYIREAKIKAAQKGILYSEEWKTKVIEQSIPPAGIDFRMNAYQVFDKKI